MIYLEKLTWQNTSKTVANVLMVATNHLKDPYRTQWLFRASVAKNYLELLSAYDSLKSMGSSVAERCSNQNFRKSEQLLMTCFARAVKFEKQLQGIKEAHMAKSIEDHTKAVTQLKEVINSHYDYFSKNADSKLKASLEKLKPLSNGLPNGKSWKEGVQERAFS